MCPVSSNSSWRSGPHMSRGNELVAERYSPGSMSRCRYTTCRSPMMARHQDAGLSFQVRPCDEGDHERAHDALEKANASTDYVPVLGHAKGIVHLIAGDRQKALASFRLSSTTTVLTAFIFDLPPEMLLVSTALPLLSMASIEEANGQVQALSAVEGQRLQQRMASASEHQKRLLQIQMEQIEKLFAMRETLGHCVRTWLLASFSSP